MKNLKKAFVVLIAAFAMMCIAKMPVMAGVSMSLSAVNGKADSITLNWNTTVTDEELCSYAVTSYTVYRDNVAIKTLDPSAKSYTDSGLKKGSRPYYRVQCDFMYTYYSSGSSYTSSRSCYTYANTMPANVSTFKLSYLNNKEAGYSVTCPSNASGVQVDQYNVKTKKHVYKTCYSYASGFTAPYGVALRYRARAYYTNSSEGKTYYGSWTKWKNYANIHVSGGSKSTKKGITIKFPGTKQVTKYVIYVAKSSSGSYKKTMTVKASSKAKSVLLKKMGKKKMAKSTRYYFKIIPYVKINGKSVKGGYTFSYSCYNFK